MALIYRGNVKSLEEQVNEYRDVINQRYREILGDENYEKLQKRANRLLVPECFFDSVEELNRVSIEKLSEHTPSKLLFLSNADLKLDNEGRIKEKNASVAFGFYINDESFKNSGSSQFTDKVIASYIHEYDHFIYGVLQKVPFYLSRACITTEFGYSPVKFNDLSLIANSILESDIPIQDKRNKIFLALNAYTMNDIWERSTRIFDKQILESIGIPLELDWRGIDRKYRGKFLEELKLVIAVPSGGDPYKSLSDKEVVRRTIEWEKYMNPVLKYQFIDNFYDSLREFKVNLMSIPELIEKYNKELEKYKNSKTHKKEQELKKQLKARRKRK